MRLDLRRYVVFDFYDNGSLRDIIESRIRELGYKTYNGVDVRDFASITIDTESGYIYQTVISDNLTFYVNYKDHEPGDLETLFKTDYYKYEEKITVCGYDVDFKKEGIKVRSHFINKADIKKIAEHFYKVEEK